MLQGTAAHWVISTLMCKPLKHICTENVDPMAPINIWLPLTAAPLNMTLQNKYQAFAISNVQMYKYT